MTEEIELTIESYFSTIPDRSLLDNRLEKPVHIAKIAKSIADWTTVWSFLSGLKANDAEAIQHDCKGLEQQKIGLLNKWRERNGPHATYRKLAQSLFDAGKIDALQVLCELLGAPHNNQPPEKKQQSGPGASPVHTPPPGNLGKRPTIPQLIDFKTKDGNINVAKRIGMNHSTFGLLLLDDKTRTIMPAIVAECFNNATNINMEVLGRWVQGQGIGPVNWATLIETLKKGGCPGLACDIESNLDLNV